MNAIVPLIQPDEYQMTVSMAKVLHGSGLLPSTVNSVEKAVAIILAGRELGVAPWQALSTINVIQGKPTISPQLMLALIERSSQLENVTVLDDGQACTVTMKRRGRQAHTETFSMADAAAMGLSSKDNWKKQPKIMRRWRCVAAAARIVFPDVILGLYTPEEMGADVVVSDEGDMRIVDSPVELIAPALPAPPDSPVERKNAVNAPNSSAAAPQAQSTMQATANAPAANLEQREANPQAGSGLKKDTDNRRLATDRPARLLSKEEATELWAWATAANGDMRLAEKDVLAALKVPKLSLFKGDLASAKSAVIAWAAANRPANLALEGGVF